MDRIRRAELGETPFEIPGDFDFDAYTASSFGVVVEAAEPVRIRFAPRWGLYVREHVWHPSQAVDDAPDGGVELRMEVGTGEELVGWVLSFGAGARVLEPASLAEAVATELRATLASYPALPYTP